MSIQVNRSASGVSNSQTVRRSQSQTLDMQPNGKIISAQPITVAEDGSKGFISQLFAMARTLMPGQSATLTVTTLTVECPAKEVTKPAIAPPPALQKRFAHNNAILATDLVIRLLYKAWMESELDDCSWPRRGYEIPEYLPDGTPYMSLLDKEAGFYHAWTICPNTMKPKYLGWLNR
ncbi:hypothetical protein [Agrobacterium tumefaciens]|uniref:hypothetical protein n=1 Tax=Agrobacterium tumefaciens TaxID=358 RepID=UPI0021D27ADD|nr:hypothetical protein [Agrobacterium tumefaciens]UXS26942.1 hypothetical protein FY153_21005 [Agrobacterium tumefaciens]UXS54559.1 hypothetical protein FY148_17765 [Agrobacterium tumefaciens]UXS65468.1 hypothetical protein FY147_21430 [Agrobacterium tumefaciens]